MIGPFLTSLDCPKVLGKNESQWPKNKDFQKTHKDLGKNGSQKGPKGKKIGKEHRKN